MRLLIYTATYMGSGHNAGGETTLHGFATAVKRAGHEVTVLASRPFADGSGSYVLDGVKVQAFASKHDPQYLFPEADVVLTQFECAQRASYLGEKLGIPTVQVVHNYTEYSTNLALRYNDYLIYNSENVKKHIEEKYDLFQKTKPSILVHPIVNPKHYSVESSREFITLVNLSDGTEPFYDKGYETFYRLAEAFPDEKFLGVKGAYGEQHIRELPNVTFMEHTNNILDVYRRTKIILMPSKTESWGRVAIEAACSGIPSLTSNAPGLVESSIGYERIPFGDYSGYSRALNSLLQNYDRASYEAKMKAERLHLSNEYQVQYFIEFLEEVSQRKA